MSLAYPVVCVSQLSGSVELTQPYTTLDIHCRHKQDQCNSGIKQLDECCTSNAYS